MDWDAEKSLGYLPQQLHSFFQSEAAYLQRQLSLHQLTVVLRDAPDPRHSNHKIRVVNEENPLWYKALYAERGRMRRYLSLPSLDRIAQGLDKNFDPRNLSYQYDSIYRNLIFQRLTLGCEDLMDYLHPCLEVCDYFELPCRREEESINGKLIFSEDIPF